MRTLIITSSYPNKSHPSDGVFVQEFAENLPCSTFTLTPNRGDIINDGHFICLLPWRGGNIPLSSLDMRKPKNWLVALHFFVAGSIATVKNCRGLKIDRVLCFWLVPSAFFGFVAWFFLGIPYDTYALGSDVWKFEKNWVGRLLLKLLCGCARHNYVDGSSLLDKLSDLGVKNLTFLPLARELPPPSAEATWPALRKQKRFLFVGRYHQNKGPDQLITAVAGMFKSHQREFKVNMFGFGPMGADLFRRISNNSLGGVVDLGDEISPQSLSDMLANTDYLVIPSRVESIPVIATDAIRAGCPIIAMPVGDLPWLIDTFKCGILAHEASPEGLRRAMLKALFAVDRSSLVPGCEEAAKLFNIRTSAKRYDARSQ